MTAPLPIFVPHTHVREATRVFLAHQQRANPVHHVDVSGDKWAYVDHFQARWDEGEAFVNLEHDVVPWPGAVEELQNCPEHWCFFGYLPGMDCAADRCAPFGMVKFTGKLIGALPDVWRTMRQACADEPRPWAQCDIFMYRYAAEGRGVHPHQHYPAVFNANPRLSGAYFPLIEPTVHQVTVWEGLRPVGMAEVRGDAEFSTRAVDGYRTVVAKAAASGCCNRCGRFYDHDPEGRRHCDPCGFWPDGYPMERQAAQ